MARCKAFTKGGRQCTFNAESGSKYCKKHQNYNPNDKTIHELNHEELKKILKDSQNKSIVNSIFIAAVTMIIGFFVSYYFFIGSVETSIDLSEKSFQDSLNLTEESINQMFLMTTPVLLKATSTINESEGRWYINITNTHSTKETGQIYLYKLEINPDKPSMRLDHSLKPGESEEFSLTLKTYEHNISFERIDDPFGFAWSLPSSKVYYVYDHESLGVRITCDFCPPTGVLLRAPEFNAIPIQMGMTNKGIQSMSINSYEWLDYQLDDVVKKE